MQVATGTIVEGKVVLEGVSLPEGPVVTVFAKDSGATVRLPLLHKGGHPYLQILRREKLFPL